MATRINLGGGDVVTIPDMVHVADCNCSPFKRGHVARECREHSRKFHKMFSNPKNADAIRAYFRKKAGRMN